MRSNGSWHWAWAGFVVKSLEALILGAYPAQARKLATFFAHNSPHSVTVYEALRWEWTAIRLLRFGTLAQRQAFRGQATRAGAAPLPWPWPRPTSPQRFLTTSRDRTAKKFRNEKVIVRSLLYWRECRG